MTEEQKKTDWKRYQYAKLAGQFAQSENTQYLVPGTLEQLASDMKEVSATESELIKDLIGKGQGLESILGIYPKKYDEERDNATIEQLVTDYDKIISGYLDEQTANYLKETLGKVGSKTLKSIKSKLDEISYKLTGDKKGYQKIEDSEELAKLQKDAVKYKSLIETLGKIEQVYFDELTPSVTKKANKNMLKQTVDELKKYY